MKKTLQFTSFLCLSLSVFTCGITRVIATKASGETSVYKKYESNKTESDDQFDFEVKKSGGSIVLDGIKDSKYPATPFLTYGGSDAKTVQAYSYHDEEALFFLFDVADKTVLKQASGSNNAYNEDGIEIYIDPKADGGTSPRTDDIQLNLGISGFSRRLKGTGTGWKINDVYVEYVVGYPSGTTLNNESDTDAGYIMEVKIPYSVLGITKKDTLRCTFAHADLTHLGDSRKWYGLANRTDQYRVSSTVIPTNYLLLTKDNVLYNYTNYLKSLERNPTVFGTVIDGVNPLKGAEVVAYSDADPYTEYKMTTSENGSYYFDNIEPKSNFHVSVSKDGYSSFSYTISSKKLQKSMSSVVSNEVILYGKFLSKVDITGSVVSNDADLSGFNVQIEGDDKVYSTDSNGKFTAKVYKNNKNVLLISKDGYETKRITLESSKCFLNNNIGTYDVYPEFVLLGEPSSTSSENTASLYATKYKDTILIKAETKYAIEGEEQLEVFINAGESSFNQNYLSTDFKVVYANNTAKVQQFDENKKSFIEVSNKNELIKIETNDTGLWEYYITIPYSVFNKTESEIIGVAAIFNNGSGYEETETSVSLDGKIDTDDTASYIRFDAVGSSFFSFSNSSNTSEKVLYTYKTNSSGEGIPENIDKTYVTYGKTDTGLSFDIVVEDSFSYHNNTQYNIRGIEALNFVFNIDDVDQTAWKLNTSSTSCDINLRIYSDNTVKYVNASDFLMNAANQIWWSDIDHTNGTSTYITPKTLTEGFTVEEKNGYKHYTLNLTYEQLAEMGGRPSAVSLSKSSDITFGLWECSETSKTTIRFYALSDVTNYVLQNKKATPVSGSLANQVNYVVIPEK